MEEVPLPGDQAPGRLREIASSAGVVLWQIICLPVVVVLGMCVSVVRMVMLALAFLGITASLVLRLSGSAPDFPFWGAIAFFGGCAALIPICQKVVRRLARGVGP